jgi:hypothetical protein
MQHFQVISPSLREKREKGRKIMFVNRVNRWGKYSPIGQVLTLGSFFKVTEVAKFYVYFFLGKCYVLI